MSFVRARMNCNSVRTKAFTVESKTADIGAVSATSVADRGDFVNIYT